MAERTYSESEAAAILESAARRQGVDGPDARVGLTLTELQQVAVAAGIGAEHVTAAAGELGRPRTLVGFQRDAMRSRLLQGPVDDETWGAIVALLRREFGAIGVTSDVGTTRAWASAASEAEVPARVTLEPEAGRSRLTISQSPGELVATLTMLGTGVLLVLGVSLALFDTHGRVMGLLLMSIAAAVYVAARVAYGRSMRRAEAHFEAVLASAAGLAEAPGVSTQALLPLDEGSSLPSDSTATRDARERA